MTATPIRDGAAMGLQFIKDRRLIVREREPQLGLVPENGRFYSRNTSVKRDFFMEIYFGVYVFC